MKFTSLPMPDEKGYFGEYGGQIIPPELSSVMNEIAEAYLEISQTKLFNKELGDLYQHYVGRPSPIFYAKRLTAKMGGAKIFLKREDLNHTGAHKINHCLGEVLLAKHMGKTKVLAETGAGQHGVALATVCALLDIDCEIHMGEVDIKKEYPNVMKMKVLGCNLVSVSRGTKTLKDAVDSAFEEYLKDPVNYFYAIGSVVGPHPFPMMVRDFQKVVGEEARQQFLDIQGKLPDVVAACVGGGSNSIGLFTTFFIFHIKLDLFFIEAVWLSHKILLLDLSLVK
jgi:tryptophan synthase beta chain